MCVVLPSTVEPQFTLFFISLLVIVALNLLILSQICGWPQTTIPKFKIITSECLQKVRIGEQISLVRYVILHNILLIQRKLVAENLSRQITEKIPNFSRQQ
ncbi:hypothetical protein ACSBR1_017563 [Camellia fascicularis]